MYDSLMISRISCTRVLKTHFVRRWTETWSTGVPQLFFFLHTQNQQGKVAKIQIIMMPINSIINIVHDIGGPNLH